MNKYIEVNLEWFEYRMASYVGLNRQLSSMRKGRRDAHGFDGTGWSEHIEGACGELAVSKHLGRYWDGSIDTFKNADLGEKIQVRTSHNHSYKLLVRPNDDDNHAYVLVTGRCPNYRIWGYIIGRDAKIDEYIDAPLGRPPAYFVPKEKLRDVNELMDKSLVIL